MEWHQRGRLFKFSNGLTGFFHYAHNTAPSTTLWARLRSTTGITCAISLHGGCRRYFNDIIPVVFYYRIVEHVAGELYPERGSLLRFICKYIYALGGDMNPSHRMISYYGCHFISFSFA